MEHSLRLSDRRRKEIATLLRKKGRYTWQQALVEGWRGVESVLDAGVPVLDLVASDSAANDPRLPAIAKRAGVPVVFAAEHVFDRLSDVQTAQGILVVVPTRFVPFEALADKRRLLVLDGVQDPGNVGTLIRTAGWFGLDAIVTGPGTADPYHPKVIRATMGGLWDVNLADAGDLGALLAALAAAGFDLVGADLDGEAIDTWQPAERTALVLGSEAHGLSAGAREALGRRVVIAGAAQRKGAESLNVAVAGGILMHHWLGKG